MQELLQQHFGFGEFRPGQREVIDAIINKGAALAVFPTGGGKSLCYQLPALAFDGVTLVVSPLIALMKDQIDFLLSRNIAAARLDSSLGADGSRRVTDQIRSGELRLLYVSPERFNNERFLSMIKQAKISLFAVDEAHCISEWGHNFRPDYLKIAETARAIGAERVLALTATATPDVVRDICRAFNIDESAAIVTGFYRRNLMLATTPVSAADRDTVLATRLRNRPVGPTIVYVTLQKTAERIANGLTSAGFEAKAYHAGMEAEERHAVQDWWMESASHIVVATIAFGMGIDKADVRYVYHYNLPKSLESYSQEIGRAGRDDKPSTVEMLACAEDLTTLENFVYGDTPTLESLRGLVGELLSLGDEFAISQYDLSFRFDIRMLVLRTALTYLELLGVFRQGTPFYAGYQFRPLKDMEWIASQFSGEPAQLVRDLFEKSKFGAKWHTLNPDEFAERLRKPRGRVAKALEYLEQHAWIELRASELRHRYYRQPGEYDADSVAAELESRYLRREQAEEARLRQVVDLVGHDGCQTNLLVAHFGEIRAEPCGHCTHCRTGAARPLQPTASKHDVPGALDVEAFKQLRAKHPAALALPRQSARFLCGLTSPALIRAKLTRNALYGALEDAHFRDVLAWLAAEG
ncbi:MAG: RecQ family ATP-dependent DNA helicase [Capsulimonadaceae bacterium]|nr:RecQ family ATP-dependent DNA helicase [Capsulimonadaceae bacterium]